MTADTAYLIDASVYVFRAWFSIGDEFVDARGRPANAIFGYSRFLVDLLERTEALHIAAAFDESLTSSFRNDIYGDYKANREPAPPELEAQFEYAKTFTDALGIYTVASDRYEADDLLAAMSRRARLHQLRVCVVSVDKDLAQVLQDNDEVWDYARNRSVTVDSLQRDLGVTPAQVPDYLALVGDSVDNIPGVRGIGPKAASALLQRFHSLQGIYDNLQAVADMPIRGAARVAENLRAGQPNANLFIQLTRLDYDAGIGQSKHVHLARRQPDWPQVDELINDLRLGKSVGERLRRLLGR